MKARNRLNIRWPLKPKMIMVFDNKNFVLLWFWMMGHANQMAKKENFYV